MSIGTKKYFDDGSSVEWVDKETLKYSKGDFSTFVWVDFEPGLFSNGRIIKAGSIQKWQTVPEGHEIVITSSERQQVIKSVQKYYFDLNKKCRIED